MKPKRIILIRHGQSDGNNNKKIYETVPDYKINLTSLGRKQAREAGKKLKDIIGEETIKFYISPFYRTRQTFDEIIESFDPKQYKKQEDPRIREQEWGHCRGTQETNKINEERDAYGSFYFRISDGESGADVYDRVTTFLDSLHREFEKDTCAENIIIITHGLTLRIFLMRWFKLTPEEFMSMRNPENCQYIIMEKCENEKYKIINN